VNSAFPSILASAAPRPVALDRVDAGDGFHRTSYAFDPAPLRRSVRASGLLQPLLLEETREGRFRIAGGFRRFAVCAELGWSTVPALLARGDPRGIFEAVLLENLSHRPFNPVEVSLALARLRAWTPEGELVAAWMPRLGLDPSPRLLASYLAVAGLEEEIRLALASGGLNAGDVPAFLRWDGPERTAVFRLFQELRMGTNLRREVALNLFEIQRRDGTPPSAFLAGEEAARAMGDPDLSVPQRAQAVRALVRKARYPLLTRLEAEFAANVKALGLPPNISIQPPPFFEGSEYRCTFTFRDEDEFRACADRIRDARHAKILPDEDRG